tara:strand:+ start:18079 stop:19272 length:1194 start_codon:yes stop_codon:yes gene_type:complete
MGFSRFRRHTPPAKKKYSGGGSDKLWPPFTAKNFILDLNESAEIRVLEPESGGSYIRKVVWVGFPRTATQDLPMFGGRDVYNYYYLKDKEEKRESNLYATTKEIFEVIDFRYFHAHVVDDPKKDGRKKLIYSPCSVEGPDGNPRKCRDCASNDPEVANRIFGGHKVWELSSKQASALYAVDDRLSETCLADVPDGKLPGDLCGNDIYCIGFECENCGDEVVSEEEIRRMDGVEIESVAYDDDYSCKNCGHKGRPKEVTICEYHEEGHHEPVRASMLDKNLTVTRAGSRSSDGKATSSLSFDTSDRFGGVIDKLREHRFSDEEINEMLEPWDLSEFFRPERVNPDKFDSDEEYVMAVLDAQAKALGVENPYRGVGGTDGPPSGSKRAVPFGNSRFARR